MIGMTLLLIAGLIALVIIAGFFIPSRFTLTRFVYIEADKKKIFNTVDDLSTWKTWSAWSPEKDPGIKITYGEKQQGTGAMMHWKGKKMGKGTMEINETTTYKEIHMQAFLNRGLFRMEFTVRLEEEKNNVKVSWTVYGRTKRSAAAKLIGRMIPRALGKDLEISLQILKLYCEGKLATP